MAVASYFSRGYPEARQRFLASAGAAGAELETRAHPAAGPEGEALATDLAWLGPKDAERVLVTISATHGVEGFCGSGAPRWAGSRAGSTASSRPGRRTS
ncbi:MAG: DUF2817 domain-containing protein [Kiloniellales bacterium]|nr:DUF2817 domain-containing protein [Kiloniellales bacterium]